MTSPVNIKCLNSTEFHCLRFELFMYRVRIPYRKTKGKLQLNNVNTKLYLPFIWVNLGTINTNVNKRIPRNLVDSVYFIGSTAKWYDKQIEWKISYFYKLCDKCFAYSNFVCFGHWIENWTFYWLMEMSIQIQIHNS